MVGYVDIQKSHLPHNSPTYLLKIISHNGRTEESQVRGLARKESGGRPGKDVCTT